MIRQPKENLDNLVEYVGLGMSFVDAAQAIGVDRRTVEKWRQRARDSLASGDPDQISAAADEIELTERMNQARATSLIAPLMCVTNAAATDPDIALKWLKSMRYEFNPSGQRLARDKIQEMYRIAREDNPELARQLADLAKKAGI